MCSVERNKKIHKSHLWVLWFSRRGISSQVHSESLVFFRWSIAIWYHLVIHHILRILLHGKTLGITMLQRLANSHQLAILQNSYCSLKSSQMVRLHHSNSCDPCRGCSSLATGCSGKHPYEPQNIKKIQRYTSHIKNLSKRGVSVMVWSGQEQQTYANVLSDCMKSAE